MNWDEFKNQLTFFIIISILTLIAMLLFPLAQAQTHQDACLTQEYIIEQTHDISVELLASDDYSAETTEQEMLNADRIWIHFLAITGQPTFAQPFSDVYNISYFPFNAGIRDYFVTDVGVGYTCLFMLDLHIGIEGS